MEHLTNICVTSFNNGYILAQYEPLVIQTILKSMDNTIPYIQGLALGSRQFQQDQLEMELASIRAMRGTDKEWSNER